MWRVSRKRREHHSIPFPLSLSHRPGLTSGYKRFLLPRLGGYTWREKSFLLIAGKHSLGTLSCLARWASLVKRICPKGTNFQDYCVIVIVISPFYSLSFPSLSWPSSPSKWLNAGRREGPWRRGKKDPILMSLFPFTHSFWILLPCDESRVCEEKGRERSPEDYHVMIIDIFIFHFSLLEIFFPTVNIFLFFSRL